MKTIVSVQEIDEGEIKPAHEVQEWRALVTAEAATRWSDRSAWVTVRCPCCDSVSEPQAFEVLGCSYVECATCGTLYAPYRPGEPALQDWYRHSPPARFLRDCLLATTSEARFEKIIGPRAQWVLDGIAEYVPVARRLVDVSYNGRLLVDTVVNGAPALEAVAAGVAADLEAPSSLKVTVRPSSVADLPGCGPADLVTAVDAFDRAADLAGLVAAIRATLRPKGVLFATLPVASGFEVQSLWGRSPTVSPPDRLNLPTITGLIRLLDGRGWELLELSTPGMFDVDIVRRTMADHPDVEWPRVLRTLIWDADVPSRQLFTEYLQARRLTSFARLVARRVD